MNGLYEIFPSLEDGLFEVRLNPEHAVFRGHFPDNPVLPGICSLIIIRECASLVAGRPLKYASVRESKFLAAITPQARIAVYVKPTKADDDFLIDAVIYSSDKTMLKLKARLRHDG